MQESAPKLPSEESNEEESHSGEETIETEAHSTEESTAESEKALEREKALKEISDKIEEARKGGLINNEAANLATEMIKLEGDEALFANRLLSRGSDPASLELAIKGEISEPTMRAHRMGPGSLKEDEREEWLILAAASIDENSVEDLPVTEKFKQFREAVNWLETASEEEKKEAADKELQGILEIPYEESEVAGVNMRVYTSDRGFASAYWSGEEYAAVDQGKLTFVGSQDRSLEEIGVKVDKQLSPNFGIIFNQ